MSIIVPKACLFQKKIKLQTAKDSVFETQMTMFVPKAKSDKPMPKIAVTISVGHDQIRLVADKSSDLMDYFAEIYAIISEKEESVTKALINARSEYILAIKKQLNETTNKSLTIHKNKI